MDHDEHDAPGVGVPGPDDDGIPASDGAADRPPAPADLGSVTGEGPGAPETTGMDPTATEPTALHAAATGGAGSDSAAPDTAVSVGDVAGGGGTGPRRLLIIGALVVAVVVVGAAAFALVQSRTGSADDALVAISEDAAVVVSIDLRHFTEGDRFDRLVAAIEPIAAETGSGITTFDEALAEIDASLQEELGVNLTDDVLPWAGRSIAFSVDGVDIETEEPEGLVIAITVRDEDAARGFVEKLAAEQDTELERTALEGASTEAYLVGEEGGLLLVEDGLLLMTLDEATMERSLATIESGEGIADDEDYRTLVDELPGDRGLRMFFDGDAFDDLAEEAKAALEEAFGLHSPAGLEDFEIPTLAVAAGLTDLGIAFDVVTRSDQEFFGAIVTPPLEADLPADTLFYLGFGSETDPPRTIGGSLRDLDREAYDAVGTFGRDFLGIDSLGELLDHLTPNFGLAVTPLLGSMPMAGAIPFDISAILSLGIDDRDAVVDIVGDIVDWLATSGIMVDEMDGVWQVLIDPQAPPLLAWTVTDDSLRIATDLGVLDQFDGPSIVGDDADGTEDGDDAAPDDLADLDAELPGDGLNFYVDIDGIAESFAPDAEEARAFSGFDAAAGGIEQRDDLHHYGMIIKLADPDEDRVDALSR